MQQEFQELLELFGEKQYSPRIPWHSYVVWRPRSHNDRADALCNLVLDSGQQVNHQVELRGVTRWIVHSDGARRKSGHVSWGFTVEGVLPAGRFLVAEHAGTCSGDRSSFEMEVMAPLVAAKYLVKHL